jgi:DNA-binding beta-propeller fold protein YncE
MVEPSSSRSGLALLVTVLLFTSPVYASTWLTAGGGGTMSVIDNDSVRGMVGDPQGHLHGGGGLSAIVINDFVGAAYVNITRSERPPMVPGQPPIVIVSLSSKSVTGVATDSQDLLQGERRAQSLQLSPDGRTLHYVQRGFVEGDLGTGEIVSIDTATNDVVRVLPIDTTPAEDLPDRMWLSFDGGP